MSESELIAKMIAADAQPMGWPAACAGIVIIFLVCLTVAFTVWRVTRK